MKRAPEHALSVLKPNSFVLKWKRVVSVLSPLSLFSHGGSHMLLNFVQLFIINSDVSTPIFIIYLLFSQIAHIWFHFAFLSSLTI